MGASPPSPLTDDPPESYFGTNEAPLDFGLLASLTIATQYKNRMSLPLRFLEKLRQPLQPVTGRRAAQVIVGMRAKVQFRGKGAILVLRGRFIQEKSASIFTRRLTARDSYILLGCHAKGMRSLWSARPET